MIKNLPLVVLAALIAGCANTSKDITEVYVSPLQYNGLDCDQLIQEEQRLRVRATQLGGTIDKTATNNNLAVGGAVFTGGLSLLFIGGNKEKEAEYARLKGEYSAVEQMQIQKRCTKQVSPQPSVSSAGSPSAQAK